MTAVHLPTASDAAPLWLCWAARSARAMTVVLILSLLVLGGALTLNGVGPIGWHAAVRATAVFALPLWLLTYTAGPLSRLAPGPATRALRTRRRALGLAFFVAQYVHLAAIVGLARVEPGILDDPIGLYGGGFGFVLIGLMAATSNDAALKRLGGRNWTRLHRFGQLTLAIVYLATYGPHFAEDVSFWPAMALLFAAYGLRATAALKQRTAST